jgi:hypothetical protein
MDRYAISAAYAFQNRQARLCPVQLSMFIKCLEFRGIDNDTIVLTSSKDYGPILLIEATREQFTGLLEDLCDAKMMDREYINFDNIDDYFLFREDW